jgi:hypothetical protein
MAWRFTDMVIDGELDNTVKGRVVGWLRVQDRAEPLRLDLDGDCHPDLAGWRFRIVRRDPPPWAEQVDLDGLATEQIGEAGDITADQTLRHYDCPPDELIARIRAGEPPPTELRKALYLEWYSQRNGRVVIQDTRFTVERLGKRAFELTAEDLRRKDEEAQRKLDELRRDGFVIEETELGVLMYRRNELDEDDPATSDLQSYLDEQSRDIDRAVEQSLDESQSDDTDPRP